MVIGTASVILVVTIGLTGKQYIIELIQKIGTNSVELEYAGGGVTSAERVRYNDFLTREDEKTVDAQLPSVMYSSPVLEMHDRISFGGGVVKDTLVLGVSPHYSDIRNLIVTVGRFLDETDNDAHIKCAVVTEIFAKERYGSRMRPSARPSRSAASLLPSSASLRRAWTTLANRRSRTRPS